MKSKGWDYIEVRKTEDIPEHSWLFGYFHSSHENWDGRTWTRNLHELRIRDLALFALGDVKGKKILDVGCGPGAYLLILSKMGALVSGQDLFDSASAFLRKNGVDADIKTGDAAKRLLFDDNYFDVVFSADFFEHISYEQKNQVVSEIYRVLKPGGGITIKTPNSDYLKITLFFKKIRAVLNLKSPFKIHIAHTRNNPDNDHRDGLTTHGEIEKILANNMFHSPQITYIPLVRRKLPMFITRFLYGKKKFTEQIVITAKKPLFYGFYK